MVADTHAITTDMRQTMVEVRKAIDVRNLAVGRLFSLRHRTNTDRHPD